MDILLQDLRYGMRMLLKNRSFAIVAILSLALGIGANTAIFSVLNAVLLRPFAYEHPEKLVLLWNTYGMAASDRTSVSASEYVDYKAQVPQFQSIAAFSDVNLNLTGTS